jgi:hypothetical protein
MKLIKKITNKIKTFPQAFRSSTVMKGSMHYENIILEYQEYKVGNYILKLPKGHLLPVYQNNGTLYDKGYIPIIQEIYKAFPDGYFIDIGANCGDTAALVKSITDAPVISVEGSTIFLPYLYQNVKMLPGKTLIVDKFLFLPELDSENLSYIEGTTTGHFEKTQTQSIISNKVYLENLISSIKKPINIFKSDTDGFDLLIVDNYIKQFHKLESIIFMELNPNYNLTSEQEVASKLKSWEKYGFSLIIFDNFGVPLTFIDNYYAAILTDLLRSVKLSTKYNRISVYYYDIWLFPKNKKFIFDTIKEGYRSNQYL